MYADTHRLAGWSGESRRFGEGAAILVGDLAFVLADELLVGAPDPVWRMWNELRTELNIGQFLDILGSVRSERRIDKAVRIARYKSGKYPIERPLHLGALLATPDRADELLPELSTYGLPLGDAFQMRDDVMGVFGDTAITGKPVGATSWRVSPRRYSPSGGRCLTRPARRARSGRCPGTRHHRRRHDQQVIIETGALDALEAAIERLSDEAIAALNSIDITAVARRELADLAHFVVGRTG